MVPTGARTASPTVAPTGARTVSPTGASTRALSLSSTGASNRGRPVSPTGARTVSPTGSSTRGRPVSPTGARTISSPVSPTIVARNVVPIIAPTIALSKYTITNPVKEIDNNIDNDIKNNIIIKKYYNSLITDLLKNKLLSLNEVENINLKIKLNITDISDIIESLEKLIKNKPNYNIENELPDDFFSPLGKHVPNKWVDEYTLLNTNKWTVPMRIPPICVNNNLCTVCPLDSANYTTTKNWNNSIYTSNK